jgi:hypothetical protein
MIRRSPEKFRLTRSSVVILIAGMGFSSISPWINASELDSQTTSPDSTRSDMAQLSAIDLRESNFGYSQFRANDNNAKKIVASAASWIVSNYGSPLNPYPFLVDKSIPGVKIFGGSILGTVPLDRDWLDIYTNSAAVMVRDAPQVEIFDWTISQAWDGIRIADRSDQFLIENVTMSDIRDDAIENDYGASGTIAKSMFDGIFSGLSMTSKGLADMTDNVVTLDTVLIRMQSFPFKGESTHQSPFKIESKSPSLKIYDSVIAINDVNHVGRSRLETAWSKILDASNNYFLNLSDQPLPDDYPLPDTDWTILQGQPARDHWAAAKKNWRSDDPSVICSRFGFILGSLGLTCGRQQ